MISMGLRAADDYRPSNQANGEGPRRSPPCRPRAAVTKRAPPCETYLGLLLTPATCSSRQAWSRSTRSLSLGCKRKPAIPCFLNPRVAAFQYHSWHCVANLRRNGQPRLPELPDELDSVLSQWLARSDAVVDPAQDPYPEHRGTRGSHFIIWVAQFPLCGGNRFLQLFASLTD
jgi:hypothetical protein